MWTVKFYSRDNDCTDCILHFQSKTPSKHTLIVWVGNYCAGIALDQTSHNCSHEYFQCHVQTAVEVPLVYLLTQTGQL